MHFKAFFLFYLCIVFVVMYMCHISCSVSLKTPKSFTGSFDMFFCMKCHWAFEHKSSKFCSFFLSKAHLPFISHNYFRILKIICFVFNVKINS